MKKRILFILLSIVLVFACVLIGSLAFARPDVLQNAFNFVINRPPSINVVSVLDEIQRTAILQTTRYNYSNMITSERELPGILAGLYGDQLVLVAVGHVLAGVDLSLIDDDDIALDTQTGTLTLTVPQAQLFECFIDDNASYVADRRTGIFSAPSPDLDVQARRYAIAVFRDESMEDGILKDAQQQTEQILVALFEAMGFKEVVIRVDDVPPPVFEGSSCFVQDGR